MTEGNMKAIRLMAAALLAASAAQVQAQTTYTDKEGGEYEFQRHAFVSVHAGVQHTVGETSFTDLLSPAVQVTAGYRFSPLLAARFSVGAWQAKGAFSGVAQPNGGFGTETYKYNYVAPTVDVMLDITNTVWGWNPERKVSLSAFAGAGADIAFSNSEAQDIAATGVRMSHLWDGTKVTPVGRGGLELALKVSDRVAVTVEGAANITSDHFNSKCGGNPDWYFTALAGVKISLGKASRKKEKPAPVVETVIPVVAPEPQPVVEEKKPERVSIRRDVFFRKNSYTIEGEGLKKVEETAEFMRQNPDVSVEVTGYADAGTGTDRVNDRISAQRAKAVADMLTTKYGISADRIKCDSKGSRVQPFEENDRNRVTICVAEGYKKQ